VLLSLSVPGEGQGRPRILARTLAPRLAEALAGRTRAAGWRSTSTTTPGNSTTRRRPGSPTRRTSCCARRPGCRR